MSHESKASSVTLGSAPVERSRVTAALAGLDARDVVAIRARAGSGKSVVLSRWTNDRPTACYFHIDPRHDAPSEFLTGLGDALGICPQHRPRDDETTRRCCLGRPSRRC